MSRAVFLSYASQDTVAARAIADALRAAGAEVWFDQNELRGGDAWDQKIRRQIKECALFVPVISENTNARPEGYFRLEWKLAVDRSHLMADDQPFLVPVAIGDVSEATARVPDRFREVQWTRLRLDETPAEFGARVQKLLAGEPAAASGREGAGAPAGARGYDAKTRRFASIWWGIVVPSVASVFGLIIAFRPEWILTRRARPAPPPAVEVGKKAAAPESEARQLAAKARALFEPWDGATREDFALAEQLLKRATTIDPTDGEIWAAYGLLTCGQIVLGHDRSEARQELARTTCERAVKLAPDSNQARFALAFSYRFREATRGGVEKMLRELLERMPEDRLLIRTLAAVLRGQRKYDESIALLERATALPGGDPVAVYNKYLALQAADRFAEAEALIDQALVAHPMPYFHQTKAMLLARVHGDLDGAAAVLARVPPEHLLEDGGAFWASQLWLWRRDPAKCLAVWRNITREIIETTDFNGPKAFVVGQAHAMAGRKAAADAEWSAALRTVEQLHASQPNQVQWVYWRARLLASLGRTQEAAEALRTFEQLRGAKGLTNDAIPIYLLLGRVEEVVEVLEKAHAALAKGNPMQLRAFEINLRFNHEWDRVREHPRAQALFAKFAVPAAAPTTEKK